MPIELNLAQLQALLRELCHLPNETEWVEFKHNNAEAGTKAMRYVPHWC
jgi:hypothetical protein